jgi:large subunit ribosomal protein L13
MNITKPTTTKQIKRTWHLIDVKGKILGRVATEIARLLMGKNKPYFVRNQDCGDEVVVINCLEVKVSGSKEKHKLYSRHSGYPGGFKSETYEKIKSTKPNTIIVKAVERMLPHNKLQDKMLARLHVFSGAEHSYKDKFQVN